jgi:hypothetical protein
VDRRESAEALENGEGGGAGLPELLGEGQQRLGVDVVEGLWGIGLRVVGVLIIENFHDVIMVLLKSLGEEGLFLAFEAH